MLRTCMLTDAKVPMQAGRLDSQDLPLVLPVEYIHTLLLLMMCKSVMTSHHFAHLLLQVLYAHLETHMLLLHLCSSCCVLSLCTLSTCRSK